MTELDHRPDAPHTRDLPDPNDVDGAPGPCPGHPEVSFDELRVECPACRAEAAEELAVVGPRPDDDDDGDIGGPCMEHPSEQYDPFEEPCPACLAEEAEDAGALHPHPDDEDEEGPTSS